MEDTSPMSSLRKTFILFVITDLVVTRGPRLYNALRNHFSQGQHLHQVIRIIYVEHCSGSVPFFYVGAENDGLRTIPPLVTITGNSLDEVVFHDYISGLKRIKDFRKSLERDLNGFSFHLCHVAVGERDDAEYVPEYPDLGASPASWHSNWKHVHSELMGLNINFSIILTNPCLINLYPEFEQPFFEISRSPIPPHIYASPYHTILFMPLSELGDSPTESLVAYETQYMTNDQPSWPHVLQCTGSDVNMQVPATDPFLNPNEGPLVSSPATVQSPGQPHVPGAPGLDPMLSGVGQPTQHGHTEELGWTGTLCLNSVRVHARALVTEAARNPKLSAWPKDLQLEKVADPIPTLDIQAWMHKTKVPVVRVGSIDGTDNWNFDQLVGAVRNGGGYATAKWENRGETLDRLLLVPVGNTLLCAALPDGGIRERPERQDPRPIRVLKQGKRRQVKKKFPAGPSVTMTTSTEGPCGEAAQSTTIPPKLQSEPEGTYCAQDTEEPTQGDSNPSYQEDVQLQETLLDEMDVDEDQDEDQDENVDEDMEEDMDDGQTDAGCESDSSDS